MSLTTILGVSPPSLQMILSPLGGVIAPTGSTNPTDGSVSLQLDNALLLTSDSGIRYLKTEDGDGDQRLDLSQLTDAQLVSNWMDEQCAYEHKLADLLRATLGIPEDAGFELSGAAVAMLDQLAAENGLVRPPLPPVAIEAGWDKVLASRDRSAASDTGMLGIVYYSAGPNYGKSMHIAFTRDGATGALTLTNAPTGNVASGLGLLLDRALAEAVRPSPDIRRFAVTGGAAENGGILAMVQSNGLDEMVAERGTDILAKIWSILKRAA